MTAQQKIEVGGLGMLRKEFPAHHISKLPKETRAQIDARKTDRNVMVFNCKVCGGHHHKDAVHLDYVGHAALTDRLLDTDIEWSWEPMAFNADGLPAFDRNNGLWIKLTVCGVTRLGYGSADGKSGGDAVKEIIGDALRNAAMRFGAALDLWHKGDLHLGDDEGQSQDGEVSPQSPAPSERALKRNMVTAPKEETWTYNTGPHKTKTAFEAAVKKLVHEIHGAGDLDMLEGVLAVPEYKQTIEQCKADRPDWYNGWEGMNPQFKPLGDLIASRRLELATPDFIQQQAANLRAG